MYAEDMKWAREHLTELPDGMKNVKAWYSNKELMEATKDTYYQGKYLRQDVRDAKNLYEQHKKTISGKVDAFMEKNGSTIAKKLNDASTKISKVVNKAKHWIKSLFD